MDNPGARGQEILEQIEFLLDYAEKAYREYMSDGRKFVYASILYSTNDKIKRLLLDEIAALPAQKRPYAMDLIFHIDVWQKYWEEAARTQTPTCDSAFSFPNTVTFPRDSVQTLLET